MIYLLGITEFYGNNGNDKIDVALSLVEHHNTLLISTKIISFFKIESFKKNMLIFRIDELNKLNIILKYKIRDFIIDNSIELVIIDSLEHLVYYEELNKEIYKSITEIITNIKQINYSLKTRFILININTNKPLTDYYNNVFGLEWNYSVNTKIEFITRNNIKFIKIRISPVLDKLEFEYQIRKGKLYFNETNIKLII
ncbi:hypothetical protein CWI38_0194p0040 [Hamiltosporidium tvaerminnensis]|uniref:Uncharacterized protein n=2 Tax=Hamiltosporidium TaxID=1176354 RepID=A0A4Q9KYI5_9MICR|nr:hypothetical protein LUQ84_003269 [Hamiltosporidium tvaerminnensis]TBU00034.1 hypothetical protein CWI37_1133p0010 [Hamiltosporidium tvaerminnensis]TBU01806.1 hypothetical protein CWI39_1301p0020 [Hamiltosporidium magnivora]TBU19821.1 hypothetical protein CWI38_0194p0040 [Hamiltosporidium tvaerminnensis]